MAEKHDEREQDEPEAPSYRPSGRSPEEAAAAGGYQGGRVTGDPKPPNQPDPLVPPEGFTNPAGAPLLPHPGVSSPDQTPEVPSTEEQMDEFAPEDRAEVEADREASEDDEDAAPKKKGK